MRRSMSALLWILVGAMASALGIGYFYYQSNQDREALAAQVEQARQEIENTKFANQKLADEANQKIALASDQIRQAQDTIIKYQKEHALLSQAVQLEKPPSRVLYSWKKVIAMPLGVSLSVPPVAKVVQSDSSLAVTTVVNRQTTDEWLTISSYDALRELALSKQFTQAEQVSYLLNGYLLVGIRGQQTDSYHQTYLLRVQAATTSTHLIWARTSKTITNQNLLDTLSTISIRS